MSRYGIETYYTFDGREPVGEYRICDYDAPRDEKYNAKIVWSRKRTAEDEARDFYPDDLRAEYERLCGRGEFINWDEPTKLNIVEMIADEDKCAWDQPCAFGYRVEGHAVYCHNNRWLYAPRKCRYGANYAWVYGLDPEKNRHENCRGFKSNPAVS